jgi:hypothetical protein
MNNYNDINDDEYDIIYNNNELFNFIYKFNSQGTIENYVQNMIKNNDLNNESFLSYFNTEEYVNNLIKSYNYKEKNIFSQFEKDYNRQNIKINGYKYNNTQLFINEINKLCDFNNKIQFCNMSWKLLIILLCCQSSFYLPYQILMNLYEIDFVNKALISDSKSNDSINIDIIINNDKIIIELCNVLFIRNINNYINTHKINNVITIEFDKKIDLELNQKPHICVFNWKIYKF